MLTKRVLYPLMILALLACSACTSVIDEPTPQTEGEGLFAALFVDAPPEVSAEITSDLQVYFLDMGQGDCELILLPNGQNMLIDGGKASDSERLLEYLSQAKVEAIDYLVATHPHEDHTGVLPAILEKLEVRSIYMPKVTDNSRVFENLLSAIDQKGLTINEAKDGVGIISAPDLRVGFVSPTGYKSREINNYSAVTKLTFGEVTFLFTGDAQKEAENKITADIKADVLKVSFHGSNKATSDAFLKRVAPRIAVISNGADNFYGFPSAKVLERLNKAGATVYRTDEQGTIKMTSDGVEILVEENANTLNLPKT